MWYAQVVASHLEVPESWLGSLSHWTLDSRQVMQGSLYVALRGEKVDGHQFLEEAKQKGAICALVDDRYNQEVPGLFLIRVKDVKETLQALAKKVIEFWKPVVIAITGSIGKTSTKEFLYTLIQDSVSVYKTPGNYNSQLTLPLTILNAKIPTHYLLLEMGMDQPGELEKLIKIAPPDIAILTQLAHVHIEAFKTFASLADEKLKLFDHPKTKLAFFNLEMPFSQLALHRGVAKKITCSQKQKKADYYLEESESKLFFYKKGELKFSFTSPLPDPKSQTNLLFALAVGDTLGVNHSVLEKQIKAIQYPDKRMKKVEHKGVLYLDDAYNSCVESVENALLALPFKRGRRIAVLSSMVEQGDYAKENHLKIAAHALNHVDLLVGFGEEMEVMIPLWRASGKKWAFFVTYSSMLSYLRKLVKEKDTVLLKGSRKYALERLICDITTD